MSISEQTYGETRRSNGGWRGAMDDLARSPSMTIPRPGRKPIRLSTDRVRARPAITPTLSGALGMGAIGLGVWGTLFPRSVARTLGLSAGPGSIRMLFGLRELTAGYALAGDPTKAGVLWLRVAGDVFDLMVLRGAAGPRGRRPGPASLALKAVALVTVLDLVAAMRMSDVQRNCEPGADR